MQHLIGVLLTKSRACDIDGRRAALIAEIQER
jgi:hypothetical protein